MKIPEVSVVMPAYNAATTIHSAISSVLAQTYTNHEIIVINDGSKDNTKEVVESFQDPRIILINSSNQGSYPSRNIGVRKARGKFIAFMDADDLWLKEKLMAQVEALQNNQKAALAYCWTDWVDINAKPLNKGIHPPHNGNVLKPLMLGNFIGNGSNPMVRKTALEVVGSFAEDIISGADWDMWLRLALHYEFVVIRKPYVLHRRSNNTWSANLRRLEKGSLEVIKRAYQRAPASMSPLKQITLKRFYLYLTKRILTLLPDAELFYTKKQRSISSLRFLGHAVFYQPSILKKKLPYRLFWRAFQMYFKA